MWLAVTWADAFRLTLAGNAVLDAHGTVLRVDSYGKIIDSPNRATVELNAGEGALNLAGGAQIDVRHGTAAVAGKGKGEHDGAARGTSSLPTPFSPRIMTFASVGPTLAIMSRKAAIAFSGVLLP